MNSSRTILITGAAGGIGQAIATAFLRAHDRVLMADRDFDAVSAVADSLGAEAIALDVTDGAVIRRTFDTLRDSQKGVDVLINGAGILSLHGAVTEISSESYRAILEVNVIGTFQMLQEFALHRIALGGGGSVVNISSIGGRQPTPGMGAYESSKAAVDSLTRWAAIELSEHQIQVNAVAPGPVLTPMLAAGMPEGSEERRSWTRRIPLGNFAGVSDVAEAVVFLAGAAHITGVSLPVDGGQLLT